MEASEPDIDPAGDRRLRRPASWDDEIVPQLVEYIRIPNKSPMFDADWVANTATWSRPSTLMERWARAQQIPGHDGRGGAPGRPHAADLHGDPGHRRRRPATTASCSTATWTSSRR